MPEKVWGTKGLEEGMSFIGKVVAARWKPVPGKFGGGEQLELEIEPTSYEGKNRFQWYKYSSRKNSVWGYFQEALEECGLVPGDNFKDENDLVDKEFEFVTKDLEFGEDRTTGSKLVASDTLLPIRLVTGPVEKAAARPELPEGDVNDLIMGAVQKEPMALEALYESAEGRFKKQEVYKAVKALEAKGQVIFEDGIVTLAA